MPGLIISLRVKDADGEIFSLPIYGQALSTVTITQLVADIQTLMSAFDDVLDGQILKAGVCIDVQLSAGLKSAPVAGSEIERTAILPFTLGQNNYTESVDVPAFAYSKFLAGTNKVNMADSDVTALTTILTTGGTYIVYGDNKANTFAESLEGYKSFRKHRRQTKRN